MVFVITLPFMIGLTCFVKFTRTGKAMRAVAQNPTAAQLISMLIESSASHLSSADLCGAASVIYALYNNTIRFDMGHRANGRLPPRCSAASQPAGRRWADC
jgi:branched-chain amino acid transport system permease protein